MSYLAFYRSRPLRWYCYGLLLLSTVACGQPAPVVQLTDGATYGHHKDHFTQGLLFSDGLIYETTGKKGESGFYRYRLGTSAKQQLALADNYFGEGLTRYGDYFYWLTWRAGVAFKIDAKQYNIVEQFEYKGEGWGLTSNNDHLIMSNGTSYLQFLNPNDFTVLRTINVKDSGKAVAKLNELEWINGYIYANVWYSDDIIKIDPATGTVVQRLSAAPLREKYGIPTKDVLNGIAYNAESGKILLTGKNWPVAIYLPLPE